MGVQVEEPSYDPLSPDLRTNTNYSRTPYSASLWLELLVPTNEPADRPAALFLHTATDTLPLLPEPRAAGFLSTRVRLARGESTLQLHAVSSSPIPPPPGSPVQVAAPGRYVLDQLGDGPPAVRKVAEPALDACLGTLRPKDKFVEVIYESSPLWLRCFAVHVVRWGGRRGGTWAALPGLPMQRYTGLDGRNQWMLRMQFPAAQVKRGGTATMVRAGYVEMYFTDGRGEFDSWGEQNYAIGLPGKYEITSGRGCVYIGPSDFDST